MTSFGVVRTASEEAAREQKTVDVKAAIRAAVKHALKKSRAARDAARDKVWLPPEQQKMVALWGGKEAA